MFLRQIFVISSLITGFSQSGSWKADPENAKIDFEVEGIFGLVHGHFSGLQATILFDEKNLAGSSFTASVDAKTVSTGISLRNSDLRNKEEWFDTEKYPRIRFTSKKIEKDGSGYKVTGDLTVKSVTKSVEIPFHFTDKSGTGLFDGEFSLRRLDYHLGTPGGSVGTDILIKLSVPVTRESR